MITFEPHRPEPQHHFTALMEEPWQVVDIINGSLWGDIGPLDWTQHIQRHTESTVWPTYCSPTVLDSTENVLVLFAIYTTMTMIQLFQKLTCCQRNLPSCIDKLSLEQLTCRISLDNSKHTDLPLGR